MTVSIISSEVFEIIQNEDGTFIATELSRKLKMCDCRHVINKIDDKKSFLLKEKGDTLYFRKEDPANHHFHEKRILHGMVRLSPRKDSKKLLIPKDAFAFKKTSPS